KKIAEPLATDYIEKGKDSSLALPTTNMTQDLFDYITGQEKISIDSSFGSTTNISMALEIEHVEFVDDKPKSPEIIEESVSDEAGSVNNEPKISPDLPANNELKPSNEEFNSQSKTYPPSYLTREQREV
ncbi:46107_t:CDS:1, partial [Gigaspora margarita]